MDAPDIEVEGLDGQVFAFPAGTGRDVMRGALAKHYASSPPVVATPDAGDASAAVGRGIISGVPIVGSYLLGGANRLAAGVRALQHDTRFSDELKNVESFGEKTAAAHPYATIGGEIGGGVVGTAPLMAAAPAAFGIGAGPLAIRAGAAALTGGSIGAGDAAVRSGGDFTATGIGGGIGSVLGGGAPVLGLAAGKVATSLASRLRPPPEPPTVEALKSGARAAYQRADDVGLQIAQPTFQDIIADIITSARTAGVDKTIHPKATAAMGRLEEASGSSPTLGDTELLRRVLKGAAGSIEPDERRIASGMIERLDDRIGTLGPQDVVAGDAQAATDAIREGRTLYGRAKRAEMIDEATLKAERRAASTGSGGNVDNATRQNIRAILDNPKRVRGFGQDERDAMDQVVRGTTAQNLARKVGKLSPEGNGLALMAALGASTVEPKALIASLVGFGAKRFADAGTGRNVQALDRMVRNGGTLPTSPLALPASEAGDELLRRLLGGTLPAANQQLSASKP